MKTKNFLNQQPHTRSHSLSLALTLSHSLSLSLCLEVPEHADQSRDASRLEDGEQALSLVGQVVEDAGCGPRGLHVACVLHCPHHRCHHLRRLHQCTPRRLLACKLVDNLCCLADHHLMRNKRGQEELILTGGSNIYT